MKAQFRFSLSGLFEVGMRNSIFIALLTVFSSAMYSQTPVPAAVETRTSDSAVRAQRTNSNPPPKARVAEVTEDYFGTHLVDPYRWMESGGDELKQWMAAQGAYTDHVLAALPSRTQLAARVHELSLGSGVVTANAIAGPYIFFSKLAPGEQLRKLAVTGADGKERVLVDPAKISGKTGHVSINNYSPSFDGKLVAVNLAEGGSEIGTIHVYDTATGAELPDHIERVWGEFQAEWLPDGKRFFYTQMPPPKPGVDAMLGWRVFLHVLGRPTTGDTLILGPGKDQAFPVSPTEFPSVRVQRGTNWMIATAGGARAESRYAVAKLAELSGEKTPWRKVSEYADGVEEAGIVGGNLILSSHKQAPNRRLLSVPLERPDLTNPRVLVAEDPKAPLEGFYITRDAIYIIDLVNGRNLLRKLAHDAGHPTPVELPYEGSVAYLVTNPLRSDWYLGMVSWTRPLRIFHSGDKGFEDTGLGQTSSADFSSIDVHEVEATADDGENVPLTILARKGIVRDGSHPAILNGYGGYGLSILPYFDAALLAWLERGGVYVYAHVRGGGEKGEGWHVAGQGKNKPRGIKDFHVCAEYLIKNGWTTSTRLAATGDSAGGVLIGRAITERPELFKAAVINVGMLNALRYLQGVNGANQTGELQATPSTPEGFHTLLAMDAYQNIKEGVSYPAVMVATAANDNRVSPWTSAKFAARLQATAPAGRPALLRVESDAGHGVGSTRDQRVSFLADLWAFVLWQAGDPGFQPEK
jgi:prolyl oligopeptidase